MRLIDADAFKRQIAAAAVQNGTTEAAHRASLMVDLIDNQPTACADTGRCTGCKSEHINTREQEECMHCSRSYSDEFEPIN